MVYIYLEVNWGRLGARKQSILSLRVVEIDQNNKQIDNTIYHRQIRPPRHTIKMKATTTLWTFIAAVELAQATVYLAGDSTMADNGANDGVTDGQSALAHTFQVPPTQTHH